MISELALRIGFVLLLPTAVVLVAGPLMLGGITLATPSWTSAFVRRQQLCREAGLQAAIAARPLRQ